MMPGLAPVIASGKRFGPWQVVGAASGTSGTATIPGYAPGDFVYVGAYAQRSAAGTPPYPTTPSAAGFVMFGSVTRSRTPVHGGTTYRERLTDLGRVMEAGDTVSTINIDYGQAWAVAVLRNSVSVITSSAGATNLSGDAVSASLTLADKSLVLGFAGTAVANNAPVFTPGGELLASTTNRAYLTLFDPPPDDVDITWAAVNAGKLVRQIDFT